MAFREADRAGGLAHEIVLLDEPPILKIPPFGTVENKIKTRLRGLFGLISRTPERFRHEHRLRMPRLDLANEPMPNPLGHLVGGIAAEAFETQAQQMLDHAQAVPIQALRVARVFVIELSQIFPHYFLAIVVAGGVGDFPVVFPYEPFRVFTRQRRIYRAMVDHQINHHLQSFFPGQRYDLSGLVFRRCGALRVQKRGINSEIICDRIQAPRSS